ncbi:DUF922 domain-containing protein [Wohlfahrtiimonas larvae]|uniref:DUF922 domain-containing protein n=1 Tax=Wohlfahrtiimonas larvae TaxID=1157986 RepID=A0ABP9MZ87_9GAMM|nr:DUF922 domain-containing protein [Wohlfahrtiimonas larvae]
MKILDKTLIYSLISIYLALFTNQAYALTLKTSENHYLVSPKDEHDVQRAIYDASPMLMNQHDANSHKYVGMHEARYSSPSYELKYRPGKLCFIHSINIQFYSNIYMPKLDMAIGRYSDKTLMKFDSELYEIRTHELQHRNIYISHLQNVLDNLRTINQKNSTFKDCAPLQRYIEQSFKNTQTTIKQKNLDLDCYEYGNKLNLTICKNARIQHQKVEQGSFSSLVQNDNAKKVVSYEDESQHTECEGKLIEPFKGKFYCVPEDSYSEW